MHCDSEIRPDYVQKAFRLLKTSIIQVETSDVVVDEEEEGVGEDDQQDGDEPDQGDGNNGDDNDESPPPDEGALETQQPVHPGAFGSEPTTQVKEPPKKKRKKTKISFEEYEAMTNMIATHLRSLERDDDDDENEEATTLKWKEIIQWYLEQVEQDLGDSVERLEETRKKLMLVIRRLVNVDHVLVVQGVKPTNKEEELECHLSVHPNYVVS